jgi:hypothetical protein
MITNIKSEWIDGDLVFSNNNGTEIARFDSSENTLSVEDLVVAEMVVTTFALSTKSDNVEDVAEATGTDVDTELNALAMAVNALKDALVDAGIMADAA